MKKRSEKEKLEAAIGYIEEMLEMFGQGNEEEDAYLELEYQLEELRAELETHE